ncbi:winged helix-turn-helix domain-containing protein [Streptomyces sp. CLV115]|uniref:helix-turn-helix domain-containing protein n=1 Tax=Streptomyces sp. CLV115 TaxID=3138502 RepID=UPI00313A9780
MERGPLAHGWADQRWTLARVKTLIGRLFHVGYTAEGTWRLLKRHGWSWQQPARRAIERDDGAVELRGGLDEVGWLRAGCRATGPAGSVSAPRAWRSTPPLPALP